ncbi:MAG TPA: F0F1 ATP synthase subunit B', partial [Alphaproteobacteria bacterium]|nr:F0F1 ATP synthase subunit B' [Alphaproteobacteria bacterium]
MRTKPLWPQLAGLALALVPGVSRAAEGGLPQLDVGTYAGQLFWLVVYFAVIYVFLWTVAIPRVSSILEERRARVGGDLDQAERLRGEADAAMQGYEATLAEAHAKARGLIAETHEKNMAALNEQTATASKRFEREVG